MKEKGRETAADRLTLGRQTNICFIQISTKKRKKVGVNKTFSQPQLRVIFFIEYNQLPALCVYNIMEMYYNVKLYI